MHFDSLATQVRHLVRSIEYHLFGNHLLANAKALVCAGSFFEGPEADTWRALGLDLLGGEIREQIFADGAHFELSPMYHSLILEDVLDLLGFSRTYPAVLAEPTAAIELENVAARMAQWLADIQHPDGQIPYFNDAVLGIASPPAELLAYAGQRGIFVNRSTGRLTLRQPSGYAVLSKPPFHVIFDCGRIGPDYLPGHAHADTLSFELSAGGERLVSNSGISTYAPGHEREWERSTRAHATVEVDGCNSAETWASFRVGRRPNVGPVECGTNGDVDWVECRHDGYRHLLGSPIHRRRVTVTSKDVRISDRIEGSGVHDVRGFLPLHPGATAERLAAHAFRLTTAGRQTFEVAIDGPIETTVQTGQFALGFGIVVPRPLVEWRWRGMLPLAVESRLAVAAMPNRG
jgi:uncharacterized heparinase superfamily protein